MRTFPMEIRAFAEAFDTLQEARHRADYAIDSRFSKRDVLAIIHNAETAIGKFEQVAVRHQRAFAVHVLFKRRQP